MTDGSVVRPVRPSRRGPAGWRRLVPWIVVSLIVGAGLWYVTERSSRRVTAETVSYALTDGNLRVTFNVTKPAGREARCTVDTQDRDHVSAGSLRDIPVPARADGHRTTTLTVQVPLTRPAYIAQITDCHLLPQS